MGARDRVQRAFGTAMLRAAGIEVKAADTGAVMRSTMTSGWLQQGVPMTTMFDNPDTAVKEAFEKVIWVYKAIDAVAAKVASWPVQVMEGDEPDWRPVKDDGLLPLLNSRANRTDGAAWNFRYRVAAQINLSKKGFFIEAIPSKAGTLAALALIHPSRIQPIPGGDFVSGYKVTYPNGQSVVLPPYDPEKKSGIVWGRRPHPTDPYSSSTPLEAAGISIDLDYDARVYNRTFLKNDGRPGQIVAVRSGDMGLSEEDAAELKARFSPGMGGVGRTSVIEAESVQVSDTSVTPRDAQYAELRNITKEDLLIAFGTPESVLGNASGRTFDNADAERENWLLDTVLMHARVIESVFDVLTDGGIDDDRTVRHDTSNEEVLQRGKRRRIESAAKDQEAGRITINEWRKIAGHDEIDRPGANVLWVPNTGKKAVGDKKDEEELSAPPPGMPQPGLPGQPAAPGLPGAAKPPARQIGQMVATPAAADRRAAAQPAAAQPRAIAAPTRGQTERKDLTFDLPAVALAAPKQINGAAVRVGDVVADGSGDPWQVTDPLDVKTDVVTLLARTPREIPTHDDTADPWVGLGG